ncbi:DNA repair protein RecO [Scytonema hofmannii FACHB-248]|uniref:DNA repair protein RecO n=1 Tax=Scytonema hofmannii FACHB-248 TaxID=1842502 RepID=A0ABR8GIY5_9CYAN|nr:MULTISPECIES: DNA repair protein RecO [Nostocales]MBD2603035.1 DNA repair protein RecO [Scytonema hofmannii FACHB-248]
MSRTYKATGINLKTQAFGEADRLVTILTREFGLIRAIAPGARKHKSSLGGRSGMFVVNELLIAQGRSLDKITQAETIKTYPGLGKDLAKLAASQYLAEIVLCQALSEQPQEELYELLNEHLGRLEAIPTTKVKNIFAHLAHAVFHLLANSGLTPQVQVCCLTQSPLTPDFSDPNPQVGFSVSSGGIISLQALERLRKEGERERGGQGDKGTRGQGGQGRQERQGGQGRQGEQFFSPIPPSLPSSSGYETIVHRQEIPVLSSRLNATELAMLQQLSQPEIMPIDAANDGWSSVEQILRLYAQYHLGRPIRSAALIDSYFAANYDATV